MISSLMIAFGIINIWNDWNLINKNLLGQLSPMIEKRKVG